MTTSVSTAAVPQTETGDFEALVRRARGGDQKAFGDLVELLWPQLVALARGMLAADDEAEDLVQDSLLHAWQRLWTLRRPQRFAAWMRRIVARRALTRARRRRPTEPLPEGAAAPRAAAPAARLDAERLLGALAPRQRAALYLTWIEGCTDREAGRLLGLRPATVRVHRFRGLENLRRMVEERR